MLSLTHKERQFLADRLGEWFDSNKTTATSALLVEFGHLLGTLAMRIEMRQGLTTVLLKDPADGDARAPEARHDTK